MGIELLIFQKLHNRTPRDYAGRMLSGKIESMHVSRKFGQEYWDGDRQYGYGGYYYDGRWEPVAQDLIEIYALDNGSSVLDVGCGKGFLLYELKRKLPGLSITGFDISEYAVSNAKEEIRSNLFIHDAGTKFPFMNKKFDFSLSLTTLHNLKIDGLKSALQEIERVSRQSYVVLDSYRDEKELFNLQCWSLTCEQFFRPEEWKWLFSEFGYSGDFEFIFF